MIYLDHNASSPLRPIAAIALQRAFEKGGNPSSPHGLGRAARRILEEARENFLHALGWADSRVVFTSGGTESAVLGVMGLAQAHRRDRGAHRVLLGPIEHGCVNWAAEQLRAASFEVEVLAADPEGRVNAAAAVARIDENVALIALMGANNETGVLQPVGAVARAASERGVPVVCDVAPVIGHLDLADLGPVTALAVSGHKFGGPMGVGALVWRGEVAPLPLWYGGGQERGVRPGTEAVPLVAGLVAAWEEALANRVRGDTGQCGEALARGVASIAGATVLASSAPRLASTVGLHLADVPAERLVEAMDAQGVVIARPPDGRSPTLAALGFSPEVMRQCVRLSYGWNTTVADLEEATQRLSQTALALRSEA